jgi:hypothetical protein
MIKNGTSDIVWKLQDEIKNQSSLYLMLRINDIAAVGKDLIFVSLNSIQSINCRPEHLAGSWKLNIQSIPSILVLCFTVKAKLIK